MQIWGHRGCRGKDNPPENSLAAFRAAMDQGADGAELDVFLTSDNHLIVFHDDTLERMTTGSGPITALSLEEIKQLRLKDNEGEPTLESIPTLYEVLNLVEDFCEEKAAPCFTLNIEIKGAGMAQHVARSIGARLKRGWQASQFLVSSFDMDSLREMKSLMPEIARGALFAGGSKPWDIRRRLLAQRLVAARDVEPATVNVTLPSIAAKTVALVQQAGAQLVAWTCDEINPEELPPRKRLALANTIKAAGLAALITDYPGPMRRLLET